MSKRLLRVAFARPFACALAALLVLALAAHASDNQKKKKNKDADQPSQAAPVINTPESDQIDHDIGEMLAAFQLGKLDMMHKYYSDNVTVVSGEYEPAIVGWDAYAPLYQKQWLAFQGIQLNRRNTLVFTHGDVAWATYEWEFDAMLSGQPYSLRGQTTLIFNKVGSDWLIVHNHTSQLFSAPTQQPAPQQSQTPAAPRP
jgi:ketosteroid isomerase-like protein